jgi:MFS family permease
MALGVVAMILFTRLHLHGGYAVDVLPGLLVIGLGMGCVFAPGFSTATLNVPTQEAGVASAMVNTSQQVGGSVGTALLSTLFASAVSSYAASHAHIAHVAEVSTIHGYTVAFWWAAGIFAVGLIVALVVLPSSIRPQPAEAAQPAGEVSTPVQEPPFAPREKPARALDVG